MTEGAPEHKGGAYRPGDMLPKVCAEFKISNAKQTKPTTNADEKVTFKVSPCRSRAELQTFFRDAEATESARRVFVHVSHQQNEHIH